MKPTLVRSDVRYWRISPHPLLRPGILCYFVALPSQKASGNFAKWETELLLPDGYSEIVFSLSAQFERWAMGGESARSLMRSSYIIGGRSHSVLTRAMGDLTIIGVKLEPPLLRRLIGTPLAEFRDSTVSLVELNQRPLLDLEDALANASSIEQITCLLDDFFLLRLSTFGPTDELVDQTIGRIREARGSFPITRWVRKHDIDERHFERRFCAWTGMTPKRYARIVRFKHSYFRMIRGEGTRGARGLHLDGYYDQSHFHRDFKYFFGSAPSAKLNDDLRLGTEITEHLIEGELQSSPRDAWESGMGNEGMRE